MLDELSDHNSHLICWLGGFKFSIQLKNKSWVIVSEYCAVQKGKTLTLNYFHCTKGIYLLLWCFIKKMNDLNYCQVVTMLR